MQPGGRRTRPVGRRFLAALAIAVTASGAPLSLAPLPGAGAAGGPSVGLPVGPSVVRAATSCTGWTSQSTPPTTIQVLRTSGPADGTVQTVPFRDYVNVVMAAEWGAADPTEALKAGAVAVKEYGWYRAMYWRGGTAVDGSCYDVVDSTIDQVYAPETKVPSASETAAVDATWGMTVQKNGGLFATHYNGGANVACGSDATGWWLYQRSAMNCAVAGMTADQILLTYYNPGATIVGLAAGAPGTPAALVFQAQPAGGSAGTAFAVQPVVTVVDSGGQPVTGTAGDGLAVSLAVAAPVPGPALTCTGGLTRTTAGGTATFDGCLLDAAAPGVVLVASAAGLASVNTAPFGIGPAVPSLQLAATAPATSSTTATAITWGQPVTLGGSLTAPGSIASAGRPVHLQRSTDGVTWAALEDVATDATGAVAWTGRPVDNAFYRLAFDGTPDLAAAASAPVRVVVRQLALLRPATGAAVHVLPRGSRVTFTATVRPARPELPKAKVTFTFRLVRGGAVVYSGRREVFIDGSGRASWTWTFGASGDWYVRAIANPTTANANSAWSPLDHYRVP